MAYVVGSAEVELVPSARGFDEKANALIGDLKVGVQLDPDILGLRARVAEITDLRVGVDLGVNSAVARAELDVLTRDRGVHIIPELASGVVKAELDVLTRPRVVEILPVELPEVGGGGGMPEGGAGGGAAGAAATGVMAAAVVGLVAALVPVANVATGAALGLGAMVSAATLGVGALAGVTVAALATNDTFKSALQPSLDGLKSSFDSLVSTNSGALLAPLQAGLGLLASILPQLSPLLQAGSQAVLALLKPLQDAVNSGAFSKFVAQLTPLIGPAVSGFGTILENLALGLGRMMAAFAPFGKTILDGLVKLSAGFATFAGSKAFQNFLSDVMKQLPLVTSFFGALFAAVGPLLPILAQFGMQILAQAADELRLIAPLLQALIPLFTAIMPVVIDTMTTFTMIAAAIGSVLLPALNWIIGVVVSVIDWLVQFGSWLGNLVAGNQAAGAGIADVWNGVMSFFAGVGQFFAGIWSNLVQGVSRMVSDVMTWFGSLPSRIGDAFAGAGSWLLDTGAQIVSGLWNGIRGAWDGFMGWIQDRINSIPKAIRDVLGIASPSKVMAEIGGFMGLGLQQGLTASLGTALDSAQTQLRKGLPGITATASAAVTATVNASTVGGGAASTTNDRLAKIESYLASMAGKAFTARELASANRLQARTGNSQVVV